MCKTYPLGELALTQINAHLQKYEMICGNDMKYIMSRDLTEERYLIEVVFLPMPDVYIIVIQK